MNDINHHAGQSTGSTRRRRRRAAGITLAACAGFVALVVGWVHHTPLSTATTARAVPAISEAHAIAPPPAVKTAEPAATAAIAPPSMDEPAPPRSAPARVASAIAPVGSRRHVHHAAAPAARRAIVDELEPSPYARR